MTCSVRLQAATLALAGVLTPTSLYAEEPAGTMSCTATQNQVIASEEGKAKIYNGIKDEFKVGDTLKINYTFSEKRATLRISDASKDRPDDLLSIFSVDNFNIEKGEAEPVEYWYDEEFRSGGVRSKMFKSEFIIFSGDRITAESLGVRLILERYYKNDWHGIVRRDMFPRLGYQIYTMDCRTEVDAIDDVILYLDKNAALTPTQ
ncbi:hypothetical protein GS624_03585 [Ruegeria sp. HKCCD5849]|uniref:hypothetical protein n=1 Tax=unclassified Ruegeria TaxID=2625375 RepID=UPI0014915FA0|nr:MULTISPECIES: hypothetical protein [unclassified Ruegeria]NOD46386.1 hypothetical protein [Ruegeria sp. HKCCD5849]NOD50314.1 hypothetical protein [Ruegeria sp. HKCCD5851]